MSWLQGFVRRHTQKNKRTHKDYRKCGDTCVDWTKVSSNIRLQRDVLQLPEVTVRARAHWVKGTMRAIEQNEWKFNYDDWRPTCPHFASSLAFSILNDFSFFLCVSLISVLSIHLLCAHFRSLVCARVYCVDWWLSAKILGDFSKLNFVYVARRCP